MRLRGGLPCLLLVCGLAACGPSTLLGHEADGATSSDGASGSSAATSAASQGSETGSIPAGSDPTSTDDPVLTTSDTTSQSDTFSCADLVWDEPGPVTSITIRNDTDEPIFVRDHIEDYCQRALFEMFDDQGASPLPWWAPGDISGLSCNDVAEGNAECPDVDCAEEEALYMEPGATHVVRWHGRFREDVVFPSICAEPYCGNECYRAEAVAEGTYTLHGQAAAGAACGPPACFDEEGEGTCWAFPYPEGCPEIEAFAELVYPSPELELVFQ